MKDKETLQIMRENDKGEITYFKTVKEVTKIGTGGHIVIPRKLVGKTVQVIFEGGKNDKR